ncbi:hypothetical protein C8R44DRAFT_718594 [Mycena epipterygia]|nr:hypothetical protein C8R44DRAFT_718594 [Mycena epipterygia]
MDEFHYICDGCLSRIEYRLVSDEIHLGTIGWLQGDSLQQIAHISNFPISNYGWNRRPTHMENGWSRLHSSCVTGGALHRVLKVNAEYWLCQANYILSQQNQKSCFIVSGIVCRLEFSGTPEKIPEGYLFLCPVEHLRDEYGRWLLNPECPGYWSLDPSGSQRLSPEEASRLGFPAFKFEMEVALKSWHESVYAALSRFHAGKGFDPNSQDLARHLGQLLYEVSRPTESAHSGYQFHVSVSCSDLVQNVVEELDSNASDDAIVAHDPSVHSGYQFHAMCLTLTSFKMYSRGIKFER